MPDTEALRPLRTRSPSNSSPKRLIQLKKIEASVNFPNGMVKICDFQRLGGSIRASAREIPVCVHCKIDEDRVRLGVFVARPMAELQRFYIEQRLICHYS